MLRASQTSNISNTGRQTSNGHHLQGRTTPRHVRLIHALPPYRGTDGGSVRIDDDDGILPREISTTPADSAAKPPPPMQQPLKHSIASVALIAALLLVPAHQASAGASASGVNVGCVKCTESNAASLLVELQEQELPALQANISKIQDPQSWQHGGIQARCDRDGGGRVGRGL